jgi:glycosyltransferase involved in cell wall biosynthesis
VKHQAISLKERTSDPTRAQRTSPFARTPDAAGAPAWSVIVPFHNEAPFLHLPLLSLASQTVGFRLILVDNGSTDGSAAIARKICEKAGLPCVLISERTAGKVAALAAGLAQVATRYVATCDADTVYPPDYLEIAGRLLAKPGVVAAGAYFFEENASRAARLGAAAHMALAARLLPQQCHSGGAGQAFDTAALRSVGGFDRAIWNWVLEDHEVFHRIGQCGSIAYSARFCCAPLVRHRSRGASGWTLGERLRYHLTPRARRSRFFYDFLENRMRARAQFSHCLRESTDG